MRSKLILAGLAAALVMAFATNSASARNISISHSQLFNITWSQLRFRTAFTEVECNVTLEGSFHYTTFRKVRESLIGYITRAIARECERGSATVLTTNLPWHIRYQGFQGTLPNINAIRIRLILVEFRLPSFSGGSCLMRSTSTEPWEDAVRLEPGNENRTVPVLYVDPEARIPCREMFNANTSVEGPAMVRELPVGFELLVRLI
jgi:hypothetical protein